ncbi:unnamed protein product [Fusarium graminearum]|uniref:Uncharacterized protein n=1 Tax=Gibberella zeae TaxID=5518 RepID=A0A9N8R8N6_GIBZA|nr:unnamed protein product [Fusarium graminearum]
MSLSQAVRDALADFPFVPAESFSGQIEGERPCYYCVLSVGRDVRCVCVAEDNAIRCVIPEELLGAAQLIINSYDAHVDLDAQNDLTPLQRWRVAQCHKDAISAFASTYNMMLNPCRITTSDRNGIAPVIQAQELAAHRGILALIYRVMTGENHTPDEVESNLASFVPAYSLSCTEADTLAECLASLDGCADCVHSKEKRSSRLAELPHGFKEDVYRAIRRLVRANNSAPAVTGPIRRGAVPVGSSRSGRSAGDGSAASARALNTRVLVSPRPIADDELPDAPLAGSVDLPEPLPARSIKSADVLLPLGPPERSGIFTKSLRSSDISDLDLETMVDNSPNFKGFKD